MNQKTNSHEHLQFLLDEHEEIFSHMQELKDWWAQLDEKGLPKFGEMGTRVKGFRDLLAKHFDDEEQEGYFKPVFDEAPGFCIMVPDFKKTHAEILFRIDDFITRLKETEPPFQNWNKALKEFEEILADLHEHEDQEVKMVQEAFNQSASKKAEI
ncbi:hemerythrin domain-containing protein [Gimesia algae]|uniref:Hemerythrin-like domain-containing protein n=1 Tax=Gimesia algae TaxID=2527971 RepID=A0A517VEZ3_9PLAN|nr:hemerythrin domain-containing protein [Gimesia algae]QDT91556.1 hypothetical protein Pan161_32150 [Gimesia algae]